jgi:DedD protein
MERRVKERLIGAAILVALVVLLVPEFLSGSHSTSALPSAPVPDLSTRTYWVDPAHVDSAPSVPPPPSASQTAMPELAPAAPAAAPPPPVAAPPQVLARAPVAAPSHAPAKPAASGGWTVQLGSFASKANAESLVRQLKSQGFNAYIASGGSKSAQRYRVRLGPIADRATASGIMAKLQAQRHASTLLPPSE